MESEIQLIFIGGKIMKITVINGTEQKGSTFHLKECFLRPLREGNKITEFYLPGDFPHFCCGCKTCFTQSDGECPHSIHTMPIWKAMQSADLIVIIFPVYASGIPGQLKALLDHFACHHMVHKPDESMFGKRAVLLSQSFRSSNRAGQKEVENSLSWLGISDISSKGFTLKDSYYWDDVTKNRRRKIDLALEKLAFKYRFIAPVNKSLKVRMYFAVSRRMIRSSLKNSVKPSSDAQYWLNQGWL
jgi:multimeric flavodoxin WrbA